MYATRSLFVLLFVTCASSLLVAGQDSSSLDSFMEKMSAGMDRLNTQMQGINDKLMSTMSRGMDGLTSRMKDMSGNIPNNLDFDMDGFASRIKDAGESMMSSMNDRMSQGSDFFSAQLLPQIQGIGENMKSLLPSMSEL